VRLGTGTQQLLVKLIQLYLAGYYHRLALTRSPKVALCLAAAVLFFYYVLLFTHLGTYLSQINSFDGN
jgi:predicted membrane protein